MVNVENNYYVSRTIGSLSLSSSIYWLYDLELNCLTSQFLSFIMYNMRMVEVLGYIYNELKIPPQCD